MASLSCTRTLCLSTFHVITEARHNLLQFSRLPLCFSPISLQSRLLALQLLHELLKL